MTHKTYTTGGAEPQASPSPPTPSYVDGRQSEAALAIQRGSMRLLASHGHTALSELALPNGRRADILALSATGRITILEVKSSVADFRADQKWPDYLAFCDSFLFAVGPEFPRDLIPPGVGLVVADRYGGEIVRDASADHPPLPPARRKALTIAIARTAMARMQALTDPEGRYEVLFGE